MSNYSLRLPESLMRAAKRIASEEKCSMNQLFLTAIAEKISALNTENIILSRAKNVDKEQFFDLLKQVPDADTDDIEDRM